MAFSPTNEHPTGHPITRRGYLILKAMAETGCSYFLASEAVSSVGVEHPDWNFDEKRAWDEWEALG